MPAVPVPATVVIVPSDPTLRTLWLNVSAMSKPLAWSTAMANGKASFAPVADPPSPLKPAEPSPATVEITPAVDTFRMRLLSVSAMKRLPVVSTATAWG